MDVIKNYSEPPKSLNLVYLAKPVYGGWVTFTAHLSQKYGYPIHKASKRKETRSRDFGYGCTYQNLPISEILTLSNILITAVDKHYWSLLQYFPTDTSIVIHDPTECKGKHNPLVSNTEGGSRILENMRVFTIRESVQRYLGDTHNIASTTKLHPFTEYPKMSEGYDYESVSVARIDFDKNTDIILKANALITDPKKRVRLFGAENRLYVHHRLRELNFSEYWMGKFPKTLEPSLNDKSILKNAKFMVDLSVIKGDGGGTQYTFLEAIHHDCILVLHNEWIKQGNTFVSGINCIGISDETELANLIIQGISKKTEKAILNASKQLLQKHLQIIW